ncbi:hypothetical protein HDU76_005871 [Blyttiomyces sp. JEL0837]|nr:hypothetical protein HDU76_005871 [Blyttiomyces sp. JEL0837]
MHTNGTNIEGNWDDIMGVVKQCQIAVHESGAPRVTTTIHIETRKDKQCCMEDRVKVVRDLMASSGVAPNSGIVPKEP